jgi:hypothetical protein
MESRLQRGSPGSSSAESLTLCSVRATEYPVRVTSSALLAAVAALAAVALLGGCTQADAIDFAMSSAYRAARPSEEVRAVAHRHGQQLLAGDLHCHVRPPDAAWHVNRTLPETIALAHTEGLDFVVLTPHVRARFFLDPVLRESTRAAAATLRANVAAIDRGSLIVVPGFEYTDGDYGHVGAAFGDLERTLAELPIAEAVAHPELFFQRYVASGGVLVINHPLVLPMDSPFSFTRNDLSWRGFTHPERGLPPEIAAIDEIAQGVEIYNLSVTHLRDRFLLGDPDRSFRLAAYTTMAAARSRHRRLAPVGGSDSHSDHLRATTWVLATERSERGIHDAITHGRTCVKSPEACSLELRGLELDRQTADRQTADRQTASATWIGVGGTIRGASRIQARAQGAEMRLYKGGELVARAAAGAVAEIDVERDRCAVFWARVGEGISAPIYVNCAF